MASYVDKSEPRTYFRVPDHTLLPKPVTDYLVNPPGLLSLLTNGIPSIYWKISGDDVVEMTTGEKIAVDITVDAERLVAAKTAAKAAYDENREEIRLILRAVVKILVDEINILRAEHGFSARTLSQARTAIRNAIDAES